MIENCALGMQSSSENGYAEEVMKDTPASFAMTIKYDSLLKETLKRVELFGVNHLYVKKWLDHFCSNGFFYKRNDEELAPSVFEFSEYV